METGAPAGEWTWADAWILASVHGGRGMTLRELIGSADAHNHAIPTRDELATGLGSLIAVGLVEVTDRGFRTTREGEALKKKHWKSGMFSWSEALLPQLQKLPKTSDEYPLTQDEVHQAYLAYSSEMGRLLGSPQRQAQARPADRPAGRMIAVRGRAGSPPQPGAR